VKIEASVDNDSEPKYYWFRGQRESGFEALTMSSIHRRHLAPSLMVCAHTSARKQRRSCKKGKEPRRAACGSWRQISDLYISLIVGIFQERAAL
jgi:hypothetical protein